MRPGHPPLPSDIQIQSGFCPSPQGGYRWRVWPNLGCPPSCPPLSSTIWRSLDKVCLPVFVPFCYPPYTRICRVRAVITLGDALRNDPATGWRTPSCHPLQVPSSPRLLEVVRQRLRLQHEYLPSLPSFTRSMPLELNPRRVLQSLSASKFKTQTQRRRFHWTSDNANCFLLCSSRWPTKWFATNVTPTTSQIPCRTFHLITRWHTTSTLEGFSPSPTPSSLAQPSTTAHSTRRISFQLNSSRSSSPQQSTSRTLPRRTSMRLNAIFAVPRLR